MILKSTSCSINSTAKEIEKLFYSINGWVERWAKLTSKDGNGKVLYF